jgi:hypothetical protein
MADSKFQSDPPAEAAPKRAAKASDPSLARALACAPCSQRDAVVSNIIGKAYARPEDLEADLIWLEAMPH